jgi:tetratricopeptide (TPR) repeat protein
MSTLLTALLLLLQAGFHEVAYHESRNIDERSYDEIMSSGLEAFYQTDWDDAQRYYDELIEIRPDDPRGYFFSSMIPFWKYFFVTEDEQAAEKFLRISGKAIHLAETQLQDKPEDTSLIAMLSGLYGYQSLVASGENKVRTALRSGRTGYGYTKQLLEIDDNMPEVHIGRGMHHYMVGSVPGALRWLVRIFGMNGDVETGFNELKIAAESESYVSTDAKMILAYLYNREENYERSLHYLYELNHQFNRNIIFRFMLAETHEQNGDIAEATKLYKNVMEVENNNLRELIELSREKIEKLNQLTL